MRRIFPLLFLVFWLAGSSVLADDIPCNLAEKPITIDGKAEDWPSLAGMFLKDQNAAVAVANDDNYLYFTFRTTDLRWVRAIKMSGITLYVDIDGGKHKDFYLRFTGGPPPEMLRPKRNGQSEGEMQGSFRGMQQPPDEQRQRQPELLLYIKDRLSEKEIPLDGTEGPAAAFDTSLGFFTYEFRIPLKYGKPLDFGLGAKQNKKIGIGLVWGDMKGMMKHDRPEGGFGGPPDDDGGFPGGGMEPREGMKAGGGGRGGDRGGRSEGMRRERPSKQEVWFKTKLATSKK